MRLAIIGSFRQHYETVLASHATFKGAGWAIASPLGDPVVEPGIPFVRFTSDREDWADALVQTVALHRILGADLVYVVAPEGYVGRTTCYEVGRIVQAERPIYFSEHPRDLPVHVPPEHVVGAAELVRRVGASRPVALLPAATDEQAELEEALVRGDYRPL